MQFTDQLGRTIVIENFPERIISLVPSQTELLCDLGLKENLVGITKFCVHPIGLTKEKTIVGGTKNLRMSVIENLQPDLIIANKEENVKEQIETLAKKIPVWISDVNNFEDALQMITAIGEITNTKRKAKSIIENIEKEKLLFTSEINLKNKSALYLIWKDPFMSVGNDTFIHDMLQQAGYKNAVGDLNRYPKLTVEEIQTLQPEIIMLSSEPYPFKEKHLEEIQAIVPNTKIIIVDGEMFSWYGSRLQYCYKYFFSLHKS
ncbi:MAG: ABC transporter substrate-binding protein [Bacteroidetes bacterium]|nr:ABC transporter substrate-binding protein [Bacteroidota bacterium]